MLSFFGMLGKVISFSYFHLNEATLSYLRALLVKNQRVSSHFDTLQHASLHASRSPE